MKRGNGVRTTERKINLNASASKAKTPAEPIEPLKPRRKLFAGVLIMLGAWVSILLTLYFTTIHGIEHRTSNTEHRTSK